MNVVLWDEPASKFPEDVIFSFAQNTPIAAAFVSMIPKAFNVSLNSSSATRFYINPEIPEIQSFLESVEPPYPLLKKSTVYSPKVVNIDTEKEMNRKTIAELMSIDIHTDKEIKFTCKAKIKEVDPSDGWWYRACPKCKSSVQNFDDKLWCKNCRYIDDIPLPWYRVKLAVEDDTRICAFVVFGHMATDLIGIPANTLANSFKERHEVPPAMNKISGVETVFQIQVSNLVDDPSNISFKVIYIFKDTLLTPKKEILSLDSTPSTHLKSPISQCSLQHGAKRKLQFLDQPSNVQQPPTENSKKKSEMRGLNFIQEEVIVP
ncbi:uncharacterized protein [Euphorbia lathyris]|uniref:uncharacterized protein isoform X2 n=1 Tax=Euphorbia lathyris TaxID=212925 RepID=UPI003313524E